MDSFDPLQQQVKVGLHAHSVTIHGAEVSPASGLSYSGPIQGKVKLRFAQGEVILPAEAFPFLESGDMVLMIVSVVKLQVSGPPPESTLILAN